MSDLIDRRAAIEAVGLNSWAGSRISNLPSVQPERAIPLSWIEEHIEWLKSLDNEFANLAAAHISVMLKKWRDEQGENN